MCIRDRNTRHAWFYTAKNNWNSVCNSGLAYGALALFEENPEISKGIIEKCMETKDVYKRQVPNESL